MRDGEVHSPSNKRDYGEDTIKGSFMLGYSGYEFAVWLLIFTLSDIPQLIFFFGTTNQQVSRWKLKLDTFEVKFHLNTELYNIWQS